MSNTTPYSDFLQNAPKLGNEFTDYMFLREYLRTFMPAEVPSITLGLDRCSREGGLHGLSAYLKVSS